MASIEEMRRIFFFTVILISQLTIAQSANDESAENVIIESKILSESRELLVSLPKNYSSQKKYPVSYVLDGESLFEGHKDVVNYLSEKNVIPEMIVVGIVNKNRSSDLTHVSDSTSNFQPNGGGQNFESFIEDELIPYIDSVYSTAPFRVLTGHSISGLFATRLALNGPDMFNAFLIIDPAIWWAEMEVLKNRKTELVYSKLNDKKLFLGIANSLPSNIESIETALKDTTNATLGIRSVFKFKDLLNRRNPEKTFWRSQFYENESHGTIPFISTYDGFKYIFNFFKRPSFQTLTDNSPTILDDHYKMLSEKMGYTILPPAYDLSGLAWRCTELEKNHDLAYLFLELFLKYYPDDPMAYMQMGQHYELIGQNEKAQEYYQKGIELGYDPNENNN